MEGNYTILINLNQKETNTMKHNGFTIVTDTSISGSHLAVARIPGIVALTTEHHDTKQDALDTIITEIDNYLFG